MLKEEFNEKYKIFFAEDCLGIETELYSETVEMLDNIFTDIIQIPGFKLFRFKVHENGALEFITSLSSNFNEMIMINIVGYEEYFTNKNLEEAKFDEEIKFEELEE